MARTTKKTSEKKTTENKDTVTKISLFDLNQKLQALDSLIEEINKQIPAVTNAELATELQDRLYKLSHIRVNVMTQMREILLND